MVAERETSCNNTLLHCAAEDGHQAVTKRCLELGAEVGATNVSGQTALHYAAENRQLGIVQILVQANADKTILDSRGRTALDCAQLTLLEGVQRPGAGDDRGSWSEIIAYLQD